MCRVILRGCRGAGLRQPRRAQQREAGRAREQERAPPRRTSPSPRGACPAAPRASPSPAYTFSSASALWASKDSAPVYSAIADSVSRSGGTGMTCSWPGGPARIVPPSVPSATVKTGIPAACARSAPCPGLSRPRVCAPSESRRIEASERPFSSLTAGGAVAAPSPVSPVAVRASSTARASASPIAVPKPGPRTSIPCVSCARSTVGRHDHLRLVRERDDADPQRRGRALEERAHRALRGGEPRRLHVRRAHRAGRVDDEHDARALVRGLDRDRRTGERDAERRERRQQRARRGCGGATRGACRRRLRAPPGSCSAPRTAAGAAGGASSPRAASGTTRRLSEEHGGLEAHRVPREQSAWSWSSTTRLCGNDGATACDRRDRPSRDRPADAHRAQQRRARLGFRPERERMARAEKARARGAAANGPHGCAGRPDAS